MAQRIELNIVGMTCDHCVHAVTGAITSVPGVTLATVDLATKSAVVEGEELDLQKVVAAVEEEGYDASVR